MRKIFYFLISIVIVLAAGWWYVNRPDIARTTQNPTAEQGGNLGNVLPAITLSGLDGKTVSVIPSGQVLVINFWATWCPPCREEMPELNRFAQKYKGSVDFYAINLQESAEKVSSFMQQNQYTMPVLLDKDGTAGRTFTINAIPTTLIVDRHGVIKFRKSGGVTVNELESVIKEL